MSPTPGLAVPGGTRGAAPAWEGSPTGYRGPRTLLVDDLGQEPLVGAGFPMDQDMGVGGGNTGQLVTEGGDGWTVSDDERQCLLGHHPLQREVLLLDALLLAYPLQHRLDLGDPDWLGQVVVRPQSHHLNGVVNRRVASQDDDVR